MSKRQTVFFTRVDPMNKKHKDPDTVDLKAVPADTVEEKSKHGVLG